MTANFTKHAKKVTFSDAKVGDRVWSLTEGWGVIINRYAPHAQYPLVVKFGGEHLRRYTLWGLLNFNDRNPTLFWDEVVIEAPTKPLPELEVDAKVLVWNDPKQKHKRHFSHFRDGVIWTFDAGHTSFTRLHKNSMTHWLYWELAE